MLTVIRGLCEVHVYVLCVFISVWNQHQLLVNTAKFISPSATLANEQQAMRDVFYCRNHFGWLNANLAVDLQLSESNTEQTLPEMRRLTSTRITSTVKNRCSRCAVGALHENDKMYKIIIDVR